MQYAQTQETGLTKRINQYEVDQKRKLVELGNSDKPYKHILSYLDNEIKQSTRMANFNHQILCFKADGVYQLNRAIEKIYGVSAGQDDSNPSKKPSNLETVDVQLANGMRVKVPYGVIELPELGEDASITISYNDTTNMLHVKGSTEFRHSSMIDEIVEQAKFLLNTDSIYRRQGIILDNKYQPEIMDLSTIDQEFMVLSERTEYELQPLMSRVRFPEKCRAAGIPLKTGVLMEGKYGTGKTLAAFKIAGEAIKNDWAFIYLKDPALLAKTLRLAKALDNCGNGVIVFVEDIDQVTVGKRDDAMQDILNTLDGGDTKNMNVIALFTTNHIEDINPTFLRGKRIGSIVSMGYFDAITSRKYLEHTFAAPYNLELEGLEEVCKNIEKSNIVPAFMAEICETVKSNMIFAETNDVKAKFIQNSLESYLHQVKLAEKKDAGETTPEKLAKSLVAVMSEGEFGKQLQAVYEQTCC